MKLILFLILGIAGISETAQSPLESPSLLKKLEAVPDLFLLSRDQAGDGDVYAAQKRIEKEYRSSGKAFRITTNFRHQEHCSKKEHAFGSANILIVNQRGKSIKLTRANLHEIELHGAVFSPAVAAFLRSLPEHAPIAGSGPAPAIATALPASGLTLVEFPGSIKVEHDVPGAYEDAGKDDPRWVVPKALLFSPPSQPVLINGPRTSFRIHATLSNPTADPFPLVLWQVNTLNPLHLHPVEDANLKRKPRDPNQPPLPMQRPLPPIRITVPANTAIRFTAVADLSDYDFGSGSLAKLEWSFHFWKAPGLRGTLPVTLP